MKKLQLLGLCGFVVALLASAQVGSATTQPKTVKAIGSPVWTLAMDWPRAAYASGKEDSRGSIHVWNVVTGATSAINGGPHGFAMHHTSELAISGKQVTWIRTQQFGNTELDHWLFTAPVGGSAHALRVMYGYTDTTCGLGGLQMGGLAGSRSAVVVSTWNAGSDGSTPTNQRLALVGPRSLRTVATGADAILSESTDGGHVAVLPFSTASVTPDGCSAALPASVFVYSTTGGAPLATIALPAVDPSTIGYQVAIRGHRLVVLTYGLHEPSGPAWVTLTVYDWTTGRLLHTWPVAIPIYPGEVNFSFYANLAAVQGPFRLHLVNLDTGRDVKIARSSHTVTALGPHGLVYASNPHNAGRLVFVPMAKLLKIAG
jgi:hypothetical protein